MSLEIEVKFPDGEVKTYPFEVMPRIGEKIEVGDNDGVKLWQITDVIHYKSTNDFQAGIVVVPITTT